MILKWQKKLESIFKNQIMRKILIAIADNYGNFRLKYNGRAADVIRQYMTKEKRTGAYESAGFVKGIL